jgi:phenylacetate-CoA ligase
MNPSLLQFYHRLPPAGRTLLASLRGHQLRRLRYTARTEELAREAMERETWSPAQWEEWRRERLLKVLHTAATQVPYYRELWAERRRRGDRSPWEELSNWPILEKDELRRNPRAFLRDGIQVSDLVHEHTSGTTGKPLDLWCGREAVREWYAIAEARWRMWHGVTRFDRWAIIGGQLVVPVSRKRPPFWVFNHGLNQLYLSAYHLSPDFIPYYLDALRRWKVVYLLGYPSAMYALAQEALRLKCTDIRLRVIIANAEPVYDYQRKAMRDAFHCPVIETYGMSEMVAAAGQCPHGTAHLWPEAGVIEVAHGQEFVTAGEVGDLVCTGLVNLDMPLIRYRVGDRGALASNAQPCPCGRTLPELACLEGRSDDVLYTRDGRQIGRLDPVFKSGLPLREAQIIQESLDRIRVIYVPAEGFRGEVHRKALIDRVRERLGDVRVELESAPEVPRTSNGKFRAVVCRLSAEEKRKIAERTESALVVQV